MALIRLNRKPVLILNKSVQTTASPAGSSCLTSDVKYHMKASFWTYFTSVYGMIWLVLIGVGLLTQTHINAGLFGLIGFPMIAVIYGIIRSPNEWDRSEEESFVLPPRMTEFLEAHPRFLNASPAIRDSEFRRWLGEVDS